MMSKMPDATIQCSTAADFREIIHNARMRCPFQALVRPPRRHPKTNKTNSELSWIPNLQAASEWRCNRRCSCRPPNELQTALLEHNYRDETYGQSIGWESPENQERSLKCPRLDYFPIQASHLKMLELSDKHLIQTLYTLLKQPQDLAAKTIKRPEGPGQTEASTLETPKSSTLNCRSSEGSAKSLNITKRPEGLQIKGTAHKSIHNSLALNPKP